MKKLMLALAVAVMAAGAQAAAVSWSSGVFNGPSGDSSKTGSAYSDVYSAVFSVYDSENNPLASDTTTDVNKKGLMKGSVDIAEPASGVTKTYYTQLVITEIATGKVLDSGKGTFTWTGGDLAAPEVTFFGDNVMGFATLPPNAGATAAGSWGGVPEPTSGILMLVGLGVLALRRRRA